MAAFRSRLQRYRVSAARMIRFDPRELLKANGKAKGLHALDEETALALTSIEVEGLKVRVDRGTAREQLMKHLGLFKEDNSQKPGVEVHVPGCARWCSSPSPRRARGRGMGCGWR
jgi:hypothetical protein